MRSYAKTAPRSPVTAAGTVAGARTATEALMLARLDGVDAYWREWTGLLLTALLEATAIARRARRLGHNAVPAGSEATMRRWLDTGAAAMPADLSGVVRLGLSGDLGERTRLVARDSAVGLVAFYDVLDMRSRRAVLTLAAWVWTGGQAAPPNVTVGEWFTARWLAVTSDTPDPNPFKYITAVRRTRRSAPARPR